MKKKTIKIPEHEAITHLRDWINECDADEIARLLGECFGGKCFQDNNDIYGETYSFTPDENYAGEFTYLKKKGKKK